MNEKRADEIIDLVTIKLSMYERFEGISSPRVPDSEERAYTRYADNLSDENSTHIFRFPKGQPYRRINNAELFRVQKPKDHIELMRRQKEFLAD